MTSALASHMPLLLYIRPWYYTWTFSICLMLFISYLCKGRPYRVWALAFTWIFLLFVLGLIAYDGAIPTPSHPVWNTMLMEQSNLYFAGMFIILAAKCEINAFWTFWGAGIASSFGELFAGLVLSH